MHEELFPDKDLNVWPPWLINYAGGTTKSYKALSAFDSSVEGVFHAQSLRPNHPVNRSVLCNVLDEQHRAYYESFPLLKRNIAALHNENVFTITTGHQLVPAFGPAFWYYKIASVVRLCKLLQSRDIQAVPILWLASEDHDVDEISSLHVYGRKVQLEKNYSGAAGRMPFELWKGFYRQILDATRQQDSTSYLLEAIRSFESFGGTLSEWTRHLALHAFGEDGLLVLDADCRELKALVTDIAEREVLNQQSFLALEQSKSEWNQFRGQDLPYPAFPRPYNFFLLNEAGRFRVERKGNGFEAGPLHFPDEDALIALIKNQPEVFSPNVILRPLFQERILPNLAYIGGPGEMAYWLQLKPVFDSYRTFFPVLIPRDSFLVLPRFFQEKWNKFGLGPHDWIKPETEVMNAFIALHTADLSFFSLQKNALEACFAELAGNIQKIDSSLVASVHAELTKTLQGIESIEKKLLRNTRKLQEDKINAIKKLLALVHPNGLPQERTLSTVDLEQLMGGKLSSFKLFSEAPVMQTKIIRL